jgi:probable HAF family extracellular repeat protein
LALLLGSLLAVPATAAAKPSAPLATPAPAARQVIDLGTLGDGYTISEAQAVNDRGQVAGDSIPAGLGPEHAFLWEHGRMRDLGTLGGTTSVAQAINEAGQVAGNSAPAPAEFNHAFLWSRGRRIDLGTLGGEFSSSTGINERGAVVGQANTAAGSMRAFVWRHGAMTNLGVLAAGENGSRANDINECGWVVGASDAAGGEFHAVLWR